MRRFQIQPRALMRSVLLVAAVLLTLVSEAALSQEVQIIRDPQNRILGKIVQRSDGDLEGRAYDNIVVGYYRRKSDWTVRANNSSFGRGNQLVALIHSYIIEKAARQRAERTLEQERAGQPSGGIDLPLPERAARPPGWTDSDERANDITNRRVQPDGREYQPKYQHQAMPDTGNVEYELRLRDWKARQERVVGRATQEDRYFAISALQTAGERRGEEVRWRNPDTGHSGSYLLLNENTEASRPWMDTFVLCLYGRMRLSTGGETYEERQTVCRMPDRIDGQTMIWRVTITHGP